MTDTIPNVPRELLERAVRIPTKASVEENHAAIVDRGRAQSELRALLSDPSPAGVDGLEVVGWYRMDDRKAITPYPSVCATWHKMGVKVGAAYSDSSHAIIDGLRGENKALHAQVKVLQSDANSWQSGYDEGRRMGGKHCSLTIDQQAQRIGELEGLLREVHGWIDESARVYRHNSTSVMLYRIDAALSAGKDVE